MESRKLLETASTSIKRLLSQEQLDLSSTRVNSRLLILLFYGPPYMFVLLFVMIYLNIEWDFNRLDSRRV